MEGKTKDVKLKSILDQVKDQQSIIDSEYGKLGKSRSSDSKLFRTMRVASLNIEKLYKEFRKESLS